MQRNRPPARTPEAREQQMIGLAVDLAERQLAEGTATSQVITHYLKLGSMYHSVEKEILEKQRDLLVAKTEAIQSQRKNEELYAEVLEALKVYSGSQNGSEY